MSNFPTLLGLVSFPTDLSIRNERLSANPNPLITGRPLCTAYAACNGWTLSQARGLPIMLTPQITDTPTGPLPQG